MHVLWPSGSQHFGVTPGENTEKGALLSVFWGRWVRKCAFKWEKQEGKNPGMIGLPWDVFVPLHGRGSQTTLGSFCKDLDSPTLCPGLIQSFTVSAFDFHGFRYDCGGARKCGFQQTPPLCSLQNGEPNNELDFTGTFTFKELQWFHKFHYTSSVITAPPAPQTLPFSQVVFCEHCSVCIFLHGANFHLTQAGLLHWCITSAVSFFARNYVTF